MTVTLLISKLAPKSSLLLAIQKRMFSVGAVSGVKINIKRKGGRPSEKQIATKLVRFRDAGDHFSAAGLLERCITEKTASEIHFNIVISMERSFEKGMVWFHRMVSPPMGISPSIWTINSLQKAARGDGDGSWRAFQMARENSLVPNTVTVSQLVDTLCRSGMREKIKMVLRDETEVPNLKSWTQILKLFAGKHDWGFLPYIKKIPLNSLDVWFANEVLKACSEYIRGHVESEGWGTGIDYQTSLLETVGNQGFKNLACLVGFTNPQEQNVHQIVDFMTERRVIPNSYTAQALLGLSGDFRWISFVDNVAKMVEGWIDPDSRNLMRLDEHVCIAKMNAIAKCGRPDRVEEVLLQMQKDGIKTSTTPYNVVMRAWGNIRAIDRVHSVLKMMPMAPDLWTYSEVLNLLSRAGEAEWCARTLEDMNKNGVKPDAVCYTCVIQAFGFKADVRSARAVYEQAISVLEPCQRLASVNSSKYQARFYPNKAVADDGIHAAMLSIYAQTGLYQEALELGRTLMHPGPFVRSTLITCASQMGNFDLARQFAGDLSDPVCAHSLMEAARVLRPDFGRNVLNAFPGKPTLALYCSYMGVCMETGDLTEASRVLDDLRRNGVIPNQKLCHSFVQICCAAEPSAGWEGLMRLLDWVAFSKKFALGDDTYALALNLAERIGHEAIIRVEALARSTTRTPAMVVYFTEDGRRVEVQNKWCAKVERFVRQIPGFNHDFSALPFLSKADITNRQQQSSLVSHAEKRALYELRDSSRPYIEVNITMCKDCHRFFECASGFMRKELFCKDFRRLHVFRNGRCVSCPT